MKIVSWNVNSLRVRLPQLADFVREFEPDVLALQETKVEDGKFPQAELEDLGYECAFTGQKSYNGVAILSRSRLSQVDLNPGGLNQPDQVRAIASTLEDGTRLVDLYVVNGQAPGSDKFAFKMRWLEDLRSYLQAELHKHPKLCVVGDFNIAPTDLDVYDPAGWKESIHCSSEERAALTAIMDLGLHDAFRLFESGRVYSWWDYRQAAFQRNQGLRIDLTLISSALKQSCSSAGIEQITRTWSQPSDHAPVWVQWG